MKPAPLIFISLFLLMMVKAGEVRFLLVKVGGTDKNLNGKKNGIKNLISLVDV